VGGLKRGGDQGNDQERHGSPCARHQKKIETWAKRKTESRSKFLEIKEEKDWGEREEIDGRMGLGGHPGESGRIRVRNEKREGKRKGALSPRKVTIKRRGVR